MTNLAFFLQGATSIIGSPFIMLLLMFGVFYFILFRPQQKRQQALREMVSQLKAGDKIITTGGVIATAAVTLIGLWVVLGPRHKPTLKDFTLAGFNNTLRENIHLGLDLRGGSHLVMQVQVPEYLQKLTEATANGVQTTATQLGYDV